MMQEKIPSPVEFTELPTLSGHKVLAINLNAERSLNALTLHMIGLIQERLDAVRTDDSVVAIILDSAGEKAFCAGGDIISLYESMTRDPSQTFAAEFFTREYQLDYAIHTYSKPIICWGSGIVLGGGIGLMNGCSHRVVTETSHLAMPECSIGLFPDVGASWFLNRMPENVGLFLGLTGNPLNAADALYLNLADFFVAQEMMPLLLAQLQQADWENSAHTVVTDILQVLQRESQTQSPQFSPARENIDTIQTTTQSLRQKEDLSAFVSTVQALETEDKWLQRAAKSLGKSSPLALQLTLRQLNSTRYCSLQEVFQSELILALNCCRRGDFREGVRALLIDKDGTPAWQWPSLEALDPLAIDACFTSPWEIHPLADLGD